MSRTGARARFCGSRPGGDSVAVLAPRGEGPAEVERVLSVTAVGRDSVWIEDDGNAKIALFVDGRLERSVSTQGDPVLAYGMRILGTDASGGRFLMTQSSYRSDFDEPWLAGQLALFDPTMEELDSVATFDMAKRRPDGVENPWPAHGVVTASGGEFVHARSDRAELVWRRADGSVRQIVRWPADPAYPDEADWEAFRVTIRAELERVNPTMGGQRLQTFLDEQVARYRLDPEAPLPLFWNLYPGDGGSVWIADFEPGLRATLPRRYEVVSADGRWLGAVEFPTRFEVMDVRGDLVLGVYRDELEVPAVAVYRVRWREG